MKARPFLATVADVEELSEGNDLVALAAPAAVVAAARPGAFVAVRCRDDGSTDPFLRRSLPLAGSSVERGIVTVWSAAVADAINWLSSRPVGALVDVVGPIGSGFRIEATTRRLMVVCDETGVGPALFLAEEAETSGTDVAVAMIVEKAARLLPVWRLPSGAEVLVATENGDLGGLDEPIGEHIRWADQVCLAIATRRLPPLKRLLDRHRIGARPAASALVERVMPCGMGLCRGCGVATRRGSRLACQDGPVFDLDQVAW